MTARAHCSLTALAIFIVLALMVASSLWPWEFQATQADDDSGDDDSGDDDSGGSIAPPFDQLPESPDQGLQGGP